MTQAIENATPPTFTHETGQQSESERIALAIQQLTQSFLFAELSPSELVELAKQCKERFAKKGDTIVQQGERGREVCLVVSGRLEVIQSAQNGANLRLGEVHHGEHFGEGALLADATRMASVRALESCYLLSLSRESLDAFFSRNAALRETLLAALWEGTSWTRYAETTQ